VRINAKWLLAWVGWIVPAAADDITLKAVFDQEARRIEVVQRVSPAVVCIFDAERSHSGSGVIISEDGYGLTNYHVIAGMLNTRRGLGGLDDGNVYPMEVLGVDITGDVAMFRLTGRDGFVWASLGDSDAVEVGDEVLAMGDPFSLAEDYSPTVTMGIVTGIKRYQGEGGSLIYTDCLQIDAAINPGNSGGPLFDIEGRIIGINGRISAEMHRWARGRFNVGLGYAISINQIKRFVPTLKAGLLGKHGTMLATVTDDVDMVVFNDMYEDAPAWNAGIRVGDRLIRFGGRAVESANEYLNILGTYPEGWPVPVSFESGGRVKHRVVRLEGIMPAMQAPYVVPEAANRRACRDAVAAGREAAFGKDHYGTPAGWSWSVERRNPDGIAVSYRMNEEGGRLSRVELDASGNEVRRTEMESERVVNIEGENAHPVAIGEALLHRALHTLHGKVLGGGDVWEEQDVEHAGSWVWRSMGTCRRGWWPRISRRVSESR